MRLKRAIAFSAATIVLTAAALAQTLPQGVQKVTSIEGVTEYAFPNGLHVLLFPDNSKPKITVNVVYLVGSRNEGYGETGMAHLLEHMVFKTHQVGPRALQGTHRPHGGGNFNGTTVLRPDHVLRDLQRQRRESALGARLWKPTAWST